MPINGAYDKFYLSILNFRKCFVAFPFEIQWKSKKIDRGATFTLSVCLFVLVTLLYAYRSPERLFGQHAYSRILNLAKLKKMTFVNVAYFNLDIKLYMFAKMPNAKKT